SREGRERTPERGERPGRAAFSRRYSVANRSLEIPPYVHVRRRAQWTEQLDATTREAHRHGCGDLLEADSIPRLRPALRLAKSRRAVKSSAIAVPARGEHPDTILDTTTVVPADREGRVGARLPRDR